MEFVTVHCQNVSVQLSEVDRISPLGNQVACLWESYWFNREQTVKAARKCVSLSNVKSQTIPLFLFITHSVLEALGIGYHYQDKGNISNLQKAPPLPPQ